MRLHRFFIEEEIPRAGTFSVVDENLLNQWRNVLRIKEHDRAILFDGSGEDVLCEFVSLNKKEAVFNILERTKGNVPLCDVTLFMALIKKDNFELVLEKATELGVTRIVPVEATRSEKKGLNYERARKIIKEASEQSFRSTVPVLEEVVSLDTIVGENLFMFDPRAKISAREFFANNLVLSAGLIVGPEGGFTETEVEAFEKRGVKIVSMGKTVLRAETAAIVALAYILA